MPTLVSTSTARKTGMGGLAAKPAREKRLNPAETSNLVCIVRVRVLSQAELNGDSEEYSNRNCSRRGNEAETDFADFARGIRLVTSAPTFLEPRCDANPDRIGPKPAGIGCATEISGSK